MHFWKAVNTARSYVKEGHTDDAVKIISRLETELTNDVSATKPQKQSFLEQFKAAYALVSSQKLSKEPTMALVSELNNIPLDEYVKTIGEGVSLVTCCMNRNENLVKALPSWVACADINEIIIVDWSSTEPVADYIAAHGFTDPRIKVIRVDNQPRWILSYAFNIGFRAASYNKILKTDADIIVYPEFFQRNFLRNDLFIAGDWRIAAKGQEHINGFFYVNRETLMKIKGFNEYITTYGWDDDDIYHRLEASGAKRTPVDTATIYHIPHDDALRVGNLGDVAAVDHLAQLHLSTRFKIRANRFIANAMPTWTKDRVFLPFAIIENQPGFLRIQQSGESIHYVPKHIRDDAEYYAELELTSWQAGLRVFDLDKRNLRKLLQAKPLGCITKLDVEVANYNQAPGFVFSEHYVLLKMQPSFVETYKTQLEPLVKQLAILCNANKRGLVLVSDSRPQVAAVIPDLPYVAFVPGWRNLGDTHTITVQQLTDMSALPQANLQITLSAEVLPVLSNILSSNKAPQLMLKRDKVFLDAQHGLGNRLRAMASGAAIAAATDRELVVVWEPDHHCECRLSDLYDYTGAVIEQAFVDDATNKGLAVYNYMEIEPGAVKDAPIILQAGQDIYARSAYVLSSEFTAWDKENQFLQALKPVEQVMALMAPFQVKHRVGAHVRMEAGKGLDHNTYDAIENWTKEGHDELHYWRDKSHYSHFIKRIDQLMKQDKNLQLFLATDLPETYQAFQQYYGDKLAFLSRTVYDRSKEQIIYALADAMLLSGCNRLLGSTWSSFSELAMRLSTSFSKIEMSGKDF
ncbi:glycosyltransferase [Rheinheimera sp. UJ51]|uniref:galactosyltransferase-related protein n=1 Tax=Rheinheimera sp. UJ51 TaxID=2892446 RepID=UPI001E46A15A|nr:galactosyltransferase-related protein [Rheinheimera sp. UJ51]MCC5450292.1 glycosyltransferase [Rheinheimera sp. UJ51]